MIDKQAEHLMSLQKNEGVRLDGQVKEKEIAAKEKFMADQAKKAEMLEMTKKYNNKLIDARDARKSATINQDKQ